jgi:hypothetical protein
MISEAGLAVVIGVLLEQAANPLQVHYSHGVLASAN